MVCQLRPFGGSFGLNYLPRIGFTLFKSRIKKIGLREQGNSRCKIAGAGFHFFAKLRAQMCTGTGTAELGKLRFERRWAWQTAVCIPRNATKAPIKFKYRGLKRLVYSGRQNYSTRRCGCEFEALETLFYFLMKTLEVLNKNMHCKINFLIVHIF
jgi:hypothetical protein